MTQINSEFVKEMQEDIQKHRKNVSFFKKMAKDETNWMRQKQRQLLSYQKRYAK